MLVSRGKSYCKIATAGISTFHLSNQQFQLKSIAKFTVNHLIYKEMQGQFFLVALLLTDDTELRGWPSCRWVGWLFDLCNVSLTIVRYLLMPMKEGTFPTPGNFIFGKKGIFSCT